MKDVNVSLDAGTMVSASCAVYLQGSALSATTVTLGGATVSAAGSWTPKPPVALTASGNVVTVLVPAGSAALVHVQ
jgi:hypothetical protein